MTGLLDVNVLVALAWPNHVHHAVAARWWQQRAVHGWATTPVTELGFVRLSSTERVVGLRVAPHSALAMLARLVEHPAHTFWPDDVRLMHNAPARLATARQVTDAHLLALATHRGGRVVTFDRGLSQLGGGAESVELLGA